MMTLINGVIVPTISFFNEKYEVNLELSSLLFRHVLLNGANALFLFGSTGEGLFFHDKIEQKVKLIELALKIFDHEVSIISGVFGNEVDEILKQMEFLGKKFKDLNFILAPPFTKKLNKNDLTSYFERLIGSFNLENGIFLYNNPNNFGKNEIDVDIVKKLMRYQNLKGIKDTTDDINNIKALIPLISEQFWVYCGEERNYNGFLKVVPLELRKFAGLVPSIGNITSICSILYKASLEGRENAMNQLQQDLNDAQNMIYDIVPIKGKEQRGLKHAFYFLYQDRISASYEEATLVTPDLKRKLDDEAKDNIKFGIETLSKRGYLHVLS